jgi:hypothetical protein
MKTRLNQFKTNVARLSRLTRGGAFILSTLLLLHCAPRAAAAPVYTLEVPANITWMDTGIYVTAGSRLDIAATGIVTYGPEYYHHTDANGVNWDGQRFMPTTVLENTTVVSLIGKIGGTTDIGTGTPLPEGVTGYGAGFVGTAYSKVIPVSGVLFLGFNDLIGSTYDNSGSFSVAVTVPEPSSAVLAGIAALAILARSRKTRFV